MSRGITLLELLIVLVVVGIIAALTLPTYRQHMFRVHRTEAMSTLLQLQGAEETFYLRQARYADDVAATPPVGLGISATSTSGKYLLSVAVAADGQSYVATATPAPGGGQDADQDCLTFSVDARGRRAVSGARDARYCWK